MYRTCLLMQDLDPDHLFKCFRRLHFSGGKMFVDFRGSEKQLLGCYKPPRKKVGSPLGPNRGIPTGAPWGIPLGDPGGTPGDPPWDTPGDDRGYSPRYTNWYPLCIFQGDPPGLDPLGKAWEYATPSSAIIVPLQLTFRPWILQPGNDQK